MVVNQTGNAILRFLTAKTRRKKKSLEKEPFHVEISISLRIDLANKKTVIYTLKRKLKASILAEDFQNICGIPYYRKLTMHVINANFKNSH